MKNRQQVSLPKVFLILSELSAVEVFFARHLTLRDSHPSPVYRVDSATLF